LGNPLLALSKDWEIGGVASIFTISLNSRCGRISGIAPQ
jgi:hypothetical protein